MINEYLFLSNDNRATVEAYRPDSISVDISNIEKTPLWTVTFSVPNKNEDSAKKLSEIHNMIMQYAPLVLSCESSEYYNRILFPLINELERKLRKLLYLAASISDNTNAKESIKQLEEKDFGEIFDLLFIDQNFILNMKKRINADLKSEFNGMSKYSKEEIKGYLDSLEEHTLWDVILGEKYVPTLRSRFRDVQSYRNNVMHAHNITKDQFGKARYLFDKINIELNAAIGKLIGVSEASPTEHKVDVNTAISSALAAMDLSALSDVLKNASQSTALLEMSSQISKMLEGMQPFKGSTAFTEALHGMLLPSIQPSLTEALKSIKPLNDNQVLAETLRNATIFQTSPAMENLRKQLSQLSEVMRPYQQMLDDLKEYNVLQESLSSITDGLPHNLNIVDEPFNTDKEETETDNYVDNTEEDISNE